MYQLCMEHRTSIGIESKTLKRIKKIKVTKKETHDETINKLIKENLIKL